MPERIRPSFINPPVSEVACGIYFQTLALMQAPHMGLFWERIREEFPRCHSVQPLAMPIDDDGQFIASLQIGNVPPLPRVWLMNTSNTSFVQVQADCIFYNWKSGSANEPYPRYPEVVTNFKRLYEVFTQFLQDERLGTVVPLQLEMAYVNNVNVSTHWRGNSEIGKVFRDFQWNRAGERYLPTPTGLHWRARFEMDLGRLDLAVQSGRRSDQPDGSDMLRFDLTARGPVPDISADTDPIWHWFDRANEWIVDGFIDLTQPDFQNDVWGRTT